MLVRIDPSSSVPLAEQVAGSLRRALAEGTLGPGDRLPAAREVARLLGINMHTVLKGYQLLREQRLIDLRRGRGGVVIATPGEARVREAAHLLIAAAHEAGLSEAETVALVRAGWAARVGASSASASSPDREGRS
ncbi:GntR family transcriptional regulator [Streptomyces sp. NPDC050619]|uniref:GntR family transcriptional regulator n=1 Tax=Streptomyces sp. NPDC050619 TaxID=3157214 RepID=UPI003434249B